MKCAGPLARPSPATFSRSAPQHDGVLQRLDPGVDVLGQGAHPGPAVDGPAAGAAASGARSSSHSRMAIDWTSRSGAWPGLATSSTGTWWAGLRAPCSARHCSPAGQVDRHAGEGRAPSAPGRCGPARPRRSASSRRAGRFTGSPAGRWCRRGCGRPASRISISTRSPAARNGVPGAPCSMCSRVRRSARQETPRAGSWLETVPEPRMRPGGEGAGAGDVGQEVGEGEVHLRPGLEVARPTAPFEPDLEPEVDPPVAPGRPELVGRDGEGREGGGRLRLEEAEPLGQLGRDEVAVARRRWRGRGGGRGGAPPRGSAPRGTSPVMTQTSPSKSSPQAGPAEAGPDRAGRAARRSRPGRPADRWRGWAAARRRAPCAPAGRG